MIEARSMQFGSEKPVTAIFGEFVTKLAVYVPWLGGPLDSH